jgi:hypothetical protein
MVPRKRSEVPVPVPPAASNVPYSGSDNQNDPAIPRLPLGVVHVHLRGREGNPFIHTLTSGSMLGVPTSHLPVDTRIRTVRK